MSRMIRFNQFGPAEVLKIEEHPDALPAPGEVQVRVRRSVSAGMTFSGDKIWLPPMPAYQPVWGTKWPAW